jgi:hypothetical protein
MPSLSADKLSRLGIFALAILLVAVSAVKPLYIDDTAFYFYARQISHFPLDPYGFSFMWHQDLSPANLEIAPPVVPYWWALGLIWLGNSVVLWKLWMFPFAWLFCYSLAELMKRLEIKPFLPCLAFLVISPLILPCLNMMLDIPAMGLYLFALLIFMRSCQNASFRSAILAGCVMAVAMETKYNALPFNAVLWAWAITRIHSLKKSLALALTATSVAVLLFSLWETYIASQYGVSHFMMKVLHPISKTEPLQQAKELFKLVGGALPFLCVLATLSLKRPKALSILITALLSVPLLVFFVIGPEFVIFAKVESFVRPLVGVLVLVAAIALLIRDLRLSAKDLVLQKNQFTLFLMMWFMVELFNYFLTSPFPAARRIYGLTIPCTLIIFRAVYDRGHVALSQKRFFRSILCGHFLLAFLFARVDQSEAVSQKELAEKIVQTTGSLASTSTTWFTGHWGFQYYAESSGMKSIIPGHSSVNSGDFIVVTHGFDAQKIDIPSSIKYVATVDIKDDVPFSMLPFYTGSDLIVYRDTENSRVSADIYQADNNLLL